MTPLLRQIRWEGVRHRVALPSLQERRVSRLVRIASATWTRELDRHIELGGVPHELPGGES